MCAFRFAHFSDPHLPLAPDRLSGRGFFTKQLLSYLSWQRKRRHVHQPSVLDCLLADIRAASADHIACTGDIANISWPGEFTRGLDWLRQVGLPQQVSYIPGNHDTMVFVPFERGLGLWRAYMQGDEAPAPDAPMPGGLFPALRRRGPVAFIGVNSGVPTAPLLATGRVGAEQLEALGDMLADLARERLFRVVMVHHPVAPGVVRRRKGLSDGAALRQLLAKVGAEMLLHGHAHKASLALLKGPKGMIPSLTVPSASATRHGRYPAAQWNLVTVDTDGGGWRVQVDVRGYDGAGAMRAVNGYTLLLPGA